MITNEEIAELERLEKAVRITPWIALHSGYDDDTHEVRAPVADSYGGTMTVADECAPHTAALIAAARNALPGLVARIRDLQSRLDAETTRADAAEARATEYCEALVPFGEVTLLPSGQAVGLERYWFERAARLTQESLTPTPASARGL